MLRLAFARVTGTSRIVHAEAGVLLADIHIFSRWHFRRGLALARAGWFPVVTTGLVASAFAASPWPPVLSVRHIMSAPNCAAARTMGLAPARRGMPGYWSKHDADNDGIACEPIPAWRLRWRGKAGRSAVSRYRDQPVAQQNRLIVLKSSFQALHAVGNLVGGRKTARGIFCQLVRK
jgi:hypothetical protein